MKNLLSLSRAGLLASAGLLSLAATPAWAQSQTPAEEQAADTGSEAGSIVVTGVKATRSATAITTTEIQKILPGVAPFKAIQTLPGVMYVTADLWIHD